MKLLAFRSRIIVNPPLQDLALYNNDAAGHDLTLKLIKLDRAKLKH